ncbi:MAG: hypothetical protein J6A19_15575 [Oscillospiraceae bacterium]|nr:hypothetical protein [Oscillospiraceae bacterium]
MNITDYRRYYPDCGRSDEEVAESLTSASITINRLTGGKASCKLPEVQSAIGAQAYFLLKHYDDPQKYEEVSRLVLNTLHRAGLIPAGC